MAPKRKRQHKAAPPAPTKPPTLRYDHKDQDNEDNGEDDYDSDDDDNYNTFEHNDNDDHLRDNRDDESLLKQWDKESVTDIPVSEPVYDIPDTAMDDLPTSSGMASGSRNDGAATETKEDRTLSRKVTEILNPVEPELDDQESPKTDTAKTITPLTQTPVVETTFNETLVGDTSLAETHEGETPLADTLATETIVNETPEEETEERPSKQVRAEPARQHSSRRSITTHVSKSASEQQPNESLSRTTSKKSEDKTKEDTKERPSKQDRAEPARKRSSQRSSTTHVSKSTSEQQPSESLSRKTSKKSADKTKEETEEHPSKQDRAEPSHKHSSQRSSTTHVFKSTSAKQPGSPSRKNSKNSADETKEHPSEQQTGQPSRRQSSPNGFVIHISKSASEENPNGSRSIKNTTESSEDQGWLPSFVSDLIRRFKEYMAPQEPQHETEADEAAAEEEAELLVSPDHFLLRSDRQTSVNKLDKEVCTVLEFDPIITPDPRPVEASNLGATVFSQPVLRIRVGSHSSPGNIHVDLDYPNKRAFLQLLPVIPELNAVYNVQNMNFLRTNSCGCVAWMGSREQLGDCKKKRISTSAQDKPSNKRRSPTKHDTQNRESDRPKTSTHKTDKKPPPSSTPTKSSAVLLDAEHTKTSKSDRSRKTSAPSDLAGRGSPRKEDRRHSRERAHSLNDVTKKSLPTEQTYSAGSDKNNSDTDENEHISPFEESNIVEVVFHSETQAERLLSLVQTLQQGFSPHVVTTTSFVPFEPMEYLCPKSKEGHFYVLSDLVNTKDLCPVVDHMAEVYDSGWSPGCPLVFKFN